MACQEERDPRPTQILLMLRITVIWSRVWRHWMPRFLFYMYIYIYSHIKNDINKQEMSVDRWRWRRLVTGSN
jgi:hypothetical protein